MSVSLGINKRPTSCDKIIAAAYNTADSHKWSMVSLGSAPVLGFNSCLFVELSYANRSTAAVEREHHAS